MCPTTLWRWRRRCDWVVERGNTFVTVTVYKDVHDHHEANNHQHKQNVLLMMQWWSSKNQFCKSKSNTQEFSWVFYQLKATHHLLKDVCVDCRSSPVCAPNADSSGQSCSDNFSDSSSHCENLSMFCEQHFPLNLELSLTERMSSMRKEVRGLTVSDISIQ